MKGESVSRRASFLRRLLILAAIGTMAVLMGLAQSARAFDPQEPGEDGNFEGQQSAVTASEGSQTGTGNNPGNPNSGVHDNGRGGNTYVNDPCLDPGPSPDATAGSRVGTAQSETDLAVDGQNIVVGYNDSLGFYRNDGGNSGFSFSVNGGNTFIDGNGLPPLVVGAGFPTTGVDHYLGDPSLVVDHKTHTFYYASIYFPATGEETLSVNAGTFQTAPPQTQESVANTRCANNSSLRQIPDTTNLPSQKIVWGPPHIAVPDQSLNCSGPPSLGNCDELDKEWLAIDQSTGELYLTYTTFQQDGSTPIDLVRSKDGGVTWEGPFVIVPNLADAFNQATQAIVTVNPVTGKPRITVTWNSRRFSLITGLEVEDSIQSAYSDDDGTTFSPVTTVSDVNPQAEPLGYNRGRSSILNAPYINVDPNSPATVYDTYFTGRTPFGQATSRAGDILISKSTDGGATWAAPVKVNDDPGTTSHVFPSVQVDKHSNVYVAWTDRRDDPANVFTNVWAAVSKDGGATFSKNRVQTDIATTWFARTDALPNFGDYNSSELLNGNQFVTTWADGRFQPPYCTGSLTQPGCFTFPGGSGGVTRNRPATPDSIFTIAQGLGN